MLHTWIKQVWDPDTDEESPRHTGGYVTPDCCDAAKRTLAIILAFGDFDSGTKKSRRPKWAISHPGERLRNARTVGWVDVPPATHCPFCGTALPKIVRRPDVPGAVCRPDSDGDYCRTCKERARYCHCFFPECAWMPVTEASKGTGREDDRSAP